MERITKSPRPFYAALFVLAGVSAFMARPATADHIKGCWYEEGDEPACDICGWNCDLGHQVCCEISEA